MSDLHTTAITSAPHSPTARLPGSGPSAAGW